MSMTASDKPDVRTEQEKSLQRRAKLAAAFHPVRRMLDFASQARLNHQVHRAWLRYPSGIGVLLLRDADG